MKFLLDFFPILLFFIAFKVWDIYAATMVAIGASVVQVAYFWFKNRKVETMHLVTMGLIVVFGGLTLILQDELFIKWKPTVINWLFGVAFLGSRFVGEKTLAERMMGASIEVPHDIWLKLNTTWAVFFIFLGLLNVYVLYNFDTDTWVDFKLFGMMGLTFVFVLVQAFYLAKHMPDEEEAEKPVSKEET